MKLVDLNDEIRDLISPAGEMSSLKDLLVQEMKDIYSAENQIIAAMPNMIRSANSPKLKKALEMHLKETRVQKQRLESAFRKLGESVEDTTCQAMIGIIKEGDEMMREDAQPAIKDAGLVSAAQKVEHYEIASYSSAIEFAKLLKERDVQRMLKENLKEEEKANMKLTRLAISEINKQAVEA